MRSAVVVCEAEAFLPFHKGAVSGRGGMLFI